MIAPGKFCVFLTFFLCILNYISTQERWINKVHDTWGIQNDSIRNLGFSYVEVPVNFPINKSLVNYTVISVDRAELAEESIDGFVSVRLNEDKSMIQFVLDRPLDEYRNEYWVANVEIFYRIHCDRTGESSKYTFMIIIEDANLAEPMFEEPTEDMEIGITLPIFPPHRRSLNDNELIRITDGDINPKFAEVDVICLEINGSAPCDNFIIEKSPAVEDPMKSKGWSHSVSIFFSNNSAINNDLGNIQTGYKFSVGLLANQSTQTVNTTINFVVESVLDVNINPTDGSDNTFPILPVAGGLSLIVLLIGIAFSYTIWRNRRTKNILRKMTEAEIREFLHGAPGFDEGAAKRSIDVNTPILAKPYNKGFEIPRNNLRIDETTVLGQGFFGVVFKGSVLHENGEGTTVAVKAVKRHVGILYFKALLSELKIMAHIGRHSNIVGLVGACTHNIRKREVYIAVEFCANGNLHNYLRAFRSNFVSLVKDGKLCGVRRESYAYNRKDSSPKQMSTLHLIKWSSQIANGLDYLSSLGIIHGDLATRNVLLDSANVAKIADFGLSRRLVDVSSYYYTKQSQAPLPWKWMSIESLKDMKFSKKSDTWSYGIVLWEIFSLGQTPFPGLNWDENFVPRLEKGLRLPPPEFASDELYVIMRDCWTENPHDRPAVDDIKRHLEQMYNSLLLQTSGEGYLRVMGNEKSLYIAVGSEETMEDSMSIDTSSTSSLYNAEC